MNFKSIAACIVAAICIIGYNGKALAAPPVQVSAQAAVVMEQGSRRVLFEKNAHQRLAMASTTKIMTALVALEEGNLRDRVIVGPNAAGVEGSSIYLKAGEELSLQSLLYGLMLQSGNDAAVAIAEHIGGSIDGFVQLMNEKAAELGAYDTNFVSVNGLDKPGHCTSAYDLALITAAAMDNADFRLIVASKLATIEADGLENGRVIKNKNKLLWNFEGANGVKTGYTKGAGRCFVGAAERSGMQLIAVVLNCGPMFEESAMLMDQAFAKFAMIPVLEPGLVWGSVKTRDGQTGEVQYGAAQRLLLPLDQEEQQRVVTNVRLWAPMMAPVAEGQPVGVAAVYLDGRELASIPLVAMQGDLRRTYGWTVKQLIEGYLWRKNGEESGFRSIWPSAG